MLEMYLLISPLGDILVLFLVSGKLSSMEVAMEMFFLCFLIPGRLSSMEVAMEMLFLFFCFLVPGRLQQRHVTSDIP